MDLSFLVHTLTLTELLVGPLRAGRETYVLQQLEALAIAEWAPLATFDERLARAAAPTGVPVVGLS